jgi:hypothetical protein
MSPRKVSTQAHEAAMEIAGAGYSTWLFDLLRLPDFDNCETVRGQGQSQFSAFQAALRGRGNFCS